MISKADLIQKILDRLGQELQSLQASAKSAHEAATNAESRAEDQHDTRGLEASYLAGAQAARAEELQRLMTRIREMPNQGPPPNAPIQVGALVEAFLDGRPVTYFLIAEGAAGWMIEEGEKSIRVITARSPIGEELMSRKAGESTEVETGRGTAELEILSVS